MYRRGELLTSAIFTYSEALNIVVSEIRSVALLAAKTAARDFDISNTVQAEIDLVIPRIEQLIDERIARAITNAFLSFEEAACSPNPKPRLRLKLAPAKARLKE